VAYPLRAVPPSLPICLPPSNCFPAPPALFENWNSRPMRAGSFFLKRASIGWGHSRLLHRKLRLGMHLTGPCTEESWRILNQQHRFSILSRFFLPREDGQAKSTRAWTPWWGRGEDRLRCYTAVAVLVARSRITPEPTPSPRLPPFRER
jgi:hypothetical protein